MKTLIAVLIASLLLALPVARAATFTITITDQALLDGVADATARYNAALPIDKNGNPVGVLTIPQYVTMVMTNAMISYSGQFVRGKIADVSKAQADAAVQAAIAGDTTSLNTLNTTAKSK